MEFYTDATGAAFCPGNGVMACQPCSDINSYTDLAGLFNNCWAISMRALITLILLLSTSCYATEQIPDRIIVDGKEYPLHSHILQPLLDRPDIHERWKALVPQNVPPCSASILGYSATWEIADNRLYLRRVHVNPCDREPKELQLSYLLPWDVSSVEAIWYSGPLFVPLGKGTLINGFHHYEKHMKLNIKNGYVVSREFEPPESNH